MLFFDSIVVLHYTGAIACDLNWLLIAVDP